MKNIIKQSTYILLATSMLATSCKKDYSNPNAATSDLVFSSAKGMMGTAICIQRTYSLNVLYGIADATGLITNETFLVNPGNLSESQFFTGGVAVDNTNALLNNVPVLFEFYRVVFHGILHLCGYNDKTKEEIQLMRSKENECLEKYVSRET